MATTPPGWYDDGRGALRWWDGAQWTEHVQTPDADSADPVDPTLATDGSAEASESGIPAAAELSDVAPEGGYPPSAPPGYPGGFPGGPTPSGGFIAATEPKKSRLWIVWVVIGVVLLGIVILAAVLIPIAIGMLGNGGGGGPSTDDEAAAVAAVELYDEAWGTGDCDKFTQATTESFREELELADCATFTAAAQGFIDSVEGYQLAVTAVEQDDDAITVETSETYSSLFDAEGNPTDEPVDYEDHYAYSVVPTGDGWAIDAVEAE